MKASTRVLQLVCLGKVNVVYYWGEKGGLLVDTGWRGSSKFILGAIRSKRLPEISLIVLTHGHLDHSGGLAGLVDLLPSVKVAAHVLELATIEGFGPRRGLEAIKTLPWLYSRPIEVDYPLNDRDRVPLFPEAEVIHCPGHTYGSIAVYLPAQRTIIVGDALKNTFGKVLLPFSSQDRKLAKKSVERLLELDFDTIFFGHGTPIYHGGYSLLKKAFYKRVVEC